MSALVPASFVSRPNRFIVIARLRGGGRVKCHLGDPGRLRELLLPGAELRLRPAGAVDGKPSAPPRKTRYSVSLVRAQAPPRPWVSLETASANRLAESLFREGRIRAVGRPAAIRREVARGASRFDFLLTSGGGERILVEVKSVSLVESGVALFPDAPTRRGTRHVLELAARARKGGRGLLLFVIQRGDVSLMRAHARTDPGFAEALAEARRSGVAVRAVKFVLDGRGRAAYAGPVRVGR